MIAFGSPFYAYFFNYFFQQESGRIFTAIV